jgi:hypothetical protein
MSGARSRTKGSRGELELLSLLGEELGVELKRNLLQVRESGPDCVDIKGFVLEVKRCERLCLPAWWRQARRQAEGIGEPMLAFRQNCKPGQSQRDAWRVLIHTKDGLYREGTVMDAANAIREKWRGWP